MTEEEIAKESMRDGMKMSDEKRETGKRKTPLMK